MKKKFTFALALALVLSLTACNNPKAEPAASSPEQSVTEVSTPDESVPEQPEEPAPTESTPEQPEETPPVEAAPEEPVSTEPIEEPTPAEPVDLFTDTNETVYATTTVNIRSKPDTNSAKLGQLSWSDSVLRTGIDTASGWSEIQLADGSIAYISSKYLTTIKPEPKPVEQQKPVEKPVEQQKPVETPKQSTNNDYYESEEYQQELRQEIEQGLGHTIDESVTAEDIRKHAEEIASRVPGGYVSDNGVIVLPPDCGLF